MKIYVEVRGGNVVECYADEKDVELILLDWDNISEGDHAITIPVSALNELPNETRQFIQPR